MTIRWEIDFFGNEPGVVQTFESDNQWYVSEAKKGWITRTGPSFNDPEGIIPVPHKTRFIVVKE